MIAGDPSQTDILVSGGGIAGLIAAAAFGAQGLSVLCVDPAPPVTDETAAGADLRTSLDLGLQQRITASLATALHAQSSPRAVAAAVAMDPRDGQVLAMASLPSFDDNVYGPPVDSAGLRAAARTGWQCVLRADHPGRAVVDGPQRCRLG